MTMLSAQVPDEVLVRVDELAVREDRSRASAVRVLVVEALDRRASSGGAVTETGARR